MSLCRVSVSVAWLWRQHPPHLHALTALRIYDVCTHDWQVVTPHCFSTNYKLPLTHTDWINEWWNIPCPHSLPGPLDPSTQCLSSWQTAAGSHVPFNCSSVTVKSTLVIILTQSWVQPSGTLGWPVVTLIWQCTGSWTWLEDKRERKMCECLKNRVRKHAPAEPTVISKLCQEKP